MRTSIIPTRSSMSNSWLENHKFDMFELSNPPFVVSMGLLKKLKLCKAFLLVNKKIQFSEENYTVLLEDITFLSKHKKLSYSIINMV